jgi:hypothetical protein
VVCGAKEVDVTAEKKTRTVDWRSARTWRLRRLQRSPQRLAFPLAAARAQFAMPGLSAYGRARDHRSRRAWRKMASILSSPLFVPCGNFLPGDGLAPKTPWHCSEPVRDGRCVPLSLLRTPSNRCIGAGCPRRAAPQDRHEAQERRDGMRDTPRGRNRTITSFGGYTGNHAQKSVPMPGRGGLPAAPSGSIRYRRPGGLARASQAAPQAHHQAQGN